METSESSNLDMNYVERSGEPTLIGDLDEIENQIEKEEKNEERKEKKIREYDEIVCRKCGLTPEIQFINNNKVDIICNCKINKNYDIIGFKNEYVYNQEENDEIIIKRPKCKSHHSDFQYFCQDCENDLCEECLTNKSFHKNHKITKYTADEKFIEDIKEVIDEFEKKIKEENSNIKEGDKNMIEIFKIIIKYYNYPYVSKDIFNHVEYPCQNFVKNIVNAHNFLPDFKEHKNQEKSNIMNANQNLNQNKLTIESKRELIQKINLIEEMYEIEIFSQNFNDLSIFEGKHFPSLKLLKLEENNIRDISPLMTAKFDELDVLNFSRNKIDNRIIDNIKKFDKVFPVLGALSLYHNYITDYDIFNEINSKIKGLRLLYIGSNNFDENTIDKINKNLYFKNLTLAGFTNGVFSDKTIDTFFTYVIIEKLKKLYLDGNNLSSLSFIKKIKFLENVEILWLSNNNLNEYESISKYNFIKLDDFNISNNRINNIKNLEHFISIQKNLTKMYLSGNEFDIFDNENKEILEKVNQNEKIQIFLD